MKIYDALFKSNLSFCISSWGAILNSKLLSVFVIQKICIRLIQVIFFNVPILLLKLKWMISTCYYQSNGERTSFRGDITTDKANAFL